MIEKRYFLHMRKIVTIFSSNICQICIKHP